MFRNTIMKYILNMTLIGYLVLMPACDAADQPGTGMGDFVQITSMQLNDGVQTFEAFRIMSSGMVEWARWNSSGYLLGHAEPYDMGSEIFNRIVSSPSFLSPKKTSNDDGVLGRPGFRLDIATLSKSGIKVISISERPDDIAKFTNELRRNIKVIPIQPGWYIWTQPYIESGKADIDLTEANDGSAIAIVLSEAVVTGRLIVRADDSIQAFISGENAHRIAFDAKFALGTMLFGVLSAK